MAAGTNGCNRTGLLTVMGELLTGIRACVFDAYGTLFDFASAAGGCAEVPAEKRAALTALWRDKQLQYAGSARSSAGTPISGG